VDYLYHRTANTALRGNFHGYLSRCHRRRLQEMPDIQDLSSNENHADEKKINPAPAAKQAKATKPASGTKAKKR